MNRFIIISVFLFSACTAQDVTPTAPVYNITITQTDNSQHIAGDNNKAKAEPKTEVKPVAEIKPELTAGAEATTRNNMWIFWTIAFFATVAGLWIVWRKWG